MSGSGNSGYSGGFEEVSSCENLSITTQISSPKQEVVSNISPGDVLIVEIQNINGSPVVVVVHNGLFIGGLAHPSIAKIRECIEKGYRFVARVLSNSGGQIKVQVQSINA
jgi:hypothetical protein